MHSKILAVSLLALIGLMSCQENSNNRQNSSKTVVIGPLHKESVQEPVVSSEYPDEIPMGRLPQTIRPKSYQLSLELDPDKDNFSGTTTIKLDIDIATSHLWLHGKDLSVSKVQLKYNKAKIFKGIYRQMDSTGVAKIEFDQPLEPGTAELIIEYSAPFNHALEGIYKVKDGELNYAFSQFEATSARLAFPGFDEPAFKVPFQTTLTVSHKHKAFTNTPTVSETDLGNGKKRIVYAKSPPLPSYLIAFAVGEFDVVKGKDIPATAIRKKPIPLKGIATKGKGSKLEYALKNTHAILLSLEDYFQQPYPYAKLDLVAAPDFAFGAMENAGLIIYREQLLLLDENAPLSQKRSYMNVHAHELAHQWFGNLVTPEWWNDIWLNEAFATWMAYTSNNQTFPEQQFKQDLLQRSLRAMGQDSLTKARQIRQPIISNHDIQSAFDSITYLKGGGVLSMIESFLTPEAFREGLQHYMQKHQFKNATADDFIRALAQKSEHIPDTLITQAFNSFLEQPGIPYLTINTQCNEKQTIVEVEQSRYLPIGSKGAQPQLWSIPACLNYSIAGSHYQHCQIIDQEKQSITLPEEGCVDYLMPNAQGAGYYRYTMPAQDWRKLLSFKDSLSTEDMISITDSFNAAINAGTLDFTDLIDIAPQLISHSSSKVSTAPIEILSFAYDKVAKTEQDKRVLAHLNQTLYSSKLDDLGLTTRDSDNVDDTQLRRALISFAAEKGQHQAVKSHLIEMAKNYTGFKKSGHISEEGIDLNLINTAIQVATKELGVDFAEHLLALLQQTHDGSTRVKLLQGLGAVQDAQYAAKLRELILSETLRDNEIYYIAYQQMNIDSIRPDMWQWFKENYEGFKSRVSAFSQSRIPRVASYFCTKKEAQEVEQFFAPIVNDIAGGPPTLEQVLETIELCADKQDHHRPAVQKFINSQQEAL